MATAWRLLYACENRRLVLRRLRWCAALSVLGTLIVGVQTVLVGGPTADRRLAFGLAYAGVSLAAWALTYAPPLARQAFAVALGYVIALLVIMAENFRWLPGDASVAPSGFVAVVIGSMVLIPWGAWAQGVIGVGALAGYAWVLRVTPEAGSPGAVGLVVTMCAVAVTAAELIERYRARSFERTWQQEQLVSLARELSADLEPAELVHKVLEHAVRLVPASLVNLSLRDPARGLYRTEAVAGPRAEEGSWVVGLEVPEDLEPVREIVARGTLTVPDDDPGGLLSKVISAHGVRRCLYVVLRYGTDVVGILNFTRRSDAPFTPGERLLAHGLADQAALALRTARLVAELRLANRHKSEFVSTMSHELRTPLNVILGYADMVGDPELDERARFDAVARIRQAGADLLELIENTLEIGRIDVGRGEARLEPLTLPLFWEELGAGCERIQRARSVVLDWRAEVPKISITTDPRKLSVIIRNLVGNALKFTEQGWVRVNSFLEGDTLVLRVTDTGIGIRREDHEAIFEMFRQADQSDTRRHGGSGLGLYIVRRFVGQLGGTVTVESEPGRGSVFSVRLPVSRSAGVEAA